MAISTTGELVHLAFAERPAYASPYPEGLAVGHVDVVGDASSGAVTVSFLAEGGFLYRLEWVQFTAGESTQRNGSFISSHRMLTDRSGLGATAFDLNHVATVRSEPLLFVIYDMSTPGTLQAIKRLPIGRTEKTASGEIVWTSILDTNTDTIVYDFDIFLAYWPIQALKLPGFLQAFWEAPIVAAPALVIP